MISWELSCSWVQAQVPIDWSKGNLSSLDFSGGKPFWSRTLDSYSLLENILLGYSSLRLRWYFLNTFSPWYRDDWVFLFYLKVTYCFRLKAWMVEVWSHRHKLQVTLKINTSWIRYLQVQFAEKVCQPSTTFLKISWDHQMESMLTSTLTWN